MTYWLLRPRGSARHRVGKEAACWHRVSELVIAWPQAFFNDLISTVDRRYAARSARRDQRELNSVEPRLRWSTLVPRFWAAALAWGKERKLLTPTEVGVLGVAGGLAAKTPTERQASRAVEALRKLQAEGYAGEAVGWRVSVGEARQDLSGRVKGRPR